jgi:hypothetical protein
MLVDAPMPSVNVAMTRAANIGWRLISRRRSAGHAYGI